MFPRLSRIARIPLAILSLLASSAVARPAAAGGAVLSPLADAPPAFVDLRMAVAVTPNGSTRWTELTLPSGARALWLVPIRPGAAIDWVPNRWLDALDDATKVRLLPPSSTVSCAMREAPETAASWTGLAANQQFASGLNVPPTSSAVLDYAGSRGYRVTSTFADALTAHYTAGWRVLLIEVPAGALMTSTGTLRVTDDGGAVLPLALTSGARITAFSIGRGRATVSGAHDIDRQALRWGPLGSSYVSWRHDLLDSADDPWLRESSSHDVLFAGVPLETTTTIPSVAESYFADPSCTGAAVAAAAGGGLVGTSCAPGAALRVPGGTPCTPSSGSIPPSTVSCAERIDLALALSATAPAETFVTRWASSISSDTFGTNLPLSFGSTASRSPVVRAASYEACIEAAAPPPPLTVPPGSSKETVDPPSDPTPFYVTEGCGGGVVAETTDEEPAPEPTSEGCSSESSSSSTSDPTSDPDPSDGWDESDSSDDSCSRKDDTSSSSSDGDSCSSKPSTPSTGDDDGWDTEDNAAPKAVKPHAMHKSPRRKSSHASRYALLGIAIVLPFRRRSRPTGPTS